MIFCFAVVVAECVSSFLFLTLLILISELMIGKKKFEMTEQEISNNEKSLVFLSFFLSFLKVFSHSFLFQTSGRNFYLKMITFRRASCRKNVTSELTRNK